MSSGDQVRERRIDQERSNRQNPITLREAVKTKGRLFKAKFMIHADSMRPDAVVTGEGIINSVKKSPIRLIEQILKIVTFHAAGCGLWSFLFGNGQKNLRTVQNFDD